MIVVSVKFKGRGKTYFFDPQSLNVPEGVQVVVETSKGLEIAECVQGNHEVTDERIVPPLRPVVRIAAPEDLRVAEQCKQREKEAFTIAEKKIADRGLDMKLVDVECNFEGSKILFFFTSDGRVDFRELVKDLAGIFRTRIELRQIGVRDEAKMLGGLGICGRPFCCHQFLDDFEPVSTKMAKTQSLSLNPTKISGSCGRLMCCLRYEQEAYEELVKHVPKNGAFVETTCGYGNVVQVNLLRQQVKVRLDGDDNSVKTFEAEEVAAIPGGRPKPGEPLPHVLEYVPKVKEPAAPAEPANPWVMPPIFAEDTVKDGEERKEPEQRSGSSHRHRNRGRKPGQGGGQPQTAEQKQKDKPAEQKQAEKPQTAEKSAEGDRQHSGGSRRHRSRGGKKPGQEGGQNQNPAAQNPGTPAPGGEGSQQQQKKSGGHSKPQQGQKPSRQNQDNNHNENKPRPNQPKAEGGTEGQGQKKSGGNNNHFRHHRPRKPGGGNGGGENKSGGQQQ